MKDGPYKKCFSDWRTEKSVLWQLALQEIEGTRKENVKYCSEEKQNKAIQKQGVELSVRKMGGGGRAGTTGLSLGVEQNGKC